MRVSPRWASDQRTLPRVRSLKLYASRPIVAATRERPDECELALIPAYHPGPVPERPSGGRLSALSRRSRRNLLLDRN